ncbi:MAG: phosphotransferase [Oscillospiraceae bacterium]|nr:phosphotransferase [Oscillospiraceae bacterium]
MLNRVVLLSIPMCEPVEFGVCEDGVYILQSWINGEDAEKSIPLLPNSEQYLYGVEAGKILKIIHTISAPLTQEDWETRFNRKIDRKITGYMDCPIKIDGGETLIEYINANRCLLKGRPQCFQHGDYHIGNMMIERGRLVIIDFDRFDFGDPWEEFNRIVWCAQKSPWFASGMIDGYFDGIPPAVFWKLLALYISSNTLSSIFWAIPFGKSEINTMVNQAKNILEWYDYMRSYIPEWYVKP